MTAEQVAEVGTLILNNDLDELQKMAKDKKSSVLTVWMAALIAKSLSKGESRGFVAVMDRIVGKAKETVELSGRDGRPMSMELTSREMTEAEMRERADALAKQRMEAGDD
jgi:hypothetical protein